MCMEGTTLNWFTTLFFKHPQTTWNDFKYKLLVRFGETRYLNAHEALGSLLQEGDIEDYIKQFESISALIPEQSEASALGMFLCGLQLDIRNWVRALRPTTCDQAMEMARHVTTATTTGDDNSTFTKKPTSFRPGSPKVGHVWQGNNSATPFTSNKPTSSPLPRTISNSRPQSGKPPDPVRHNPNSNHSVGTKNLTKQEWEDRRKRGLCFSCG